MEPTGRSGEKRRQKEQMEIKPLGHSSPQLSNTTRKKIWCPKRSRRADPERRERRRNDPWGPRNEAKTVQPEETRQAGGSSEQEDDVKRSRAKEKKRKR